MYREVGDIFKFFDHLSTTNDTVVLEVVEKEDCKGCYFKDTCFINPNKKDITGFCAKHNRDDNKNVIFKRIK